MLERKMPLKNGFDLTHGLWLPQLFVVITGSFTLLTGQMGICSEKCIRLSILVLSSGIDSVQLLLCCTYPCLPPGLPVVRTR